MTLNARETTLRDYFVRQVLECGGAVKPIDPDAAGFYEVHWPDGRMECIELVLREPERANQCHVVLWNNGSIDWWLEGVVDLSAKPPRYRTVKDAQGR